MRISVDLDGVTADFQGGWRRAYYQWFGVQIPDERAKHWDALVTETHFTSSSEFFKWLQTVPGFWQNLDPIPGSLGALNQLREDGHDVVFCSNRHSWAKQPTQSWLKKVGLGWGAADFIQVSSAKTKAVAEADVWVDDNPKVIKDLSSQGLQVIRFEQPWNRDMDTPAGVAVARSWQDVLRIVKGYDR